MGERRHGLMAMQAALGVMSAGWMAGIAVLVTAQKLMPPNAALDVPVAAAIIVLGIWIIWRPRRFLGSPRRCETSTGGVGHAQR